MMTCGAVAGAVAAAVWRERVIRFDTGHGILLDPIYERPPGPTTRQTFEQAFVFVVPRVGMYVRLTGV